MNRNQRRMAAFNARKASEASHGHGMVAFSGEDDVQLVFATDSTMGPLVRHGDTGNLSHWRNDNDATFIAAANPDTILAIAEAFRAQEQRAEAAEAKLAQREKLDEEAMHCATILEFIGSFESDDIDGDLVDLRFEIDGEDTGSDVSITEYALRSAKAIRAIISGASISRPAPAADLVPIGRVDRGEVSDNNEYPNTRVVCLHDQADWENFQDGTELYLRPAPAADLADLVPPEADGSNLPFAANGWNACRAAILRNIEEANK